MTTTAESTKWVTVDQAGEHIGRSKRRVWEYVAAADGKIRTMRLRVEGRMKTFINLPDLLDYEATVAAPGRPRKEQAS